MNSFYPKKYFDEYATEEQKINITYYFNNYNLKELKQLCKEANIKQYSYRNKDELAVMLATNKSMTDLHNLMY